MFADAGNLIGYSGPTDFSNFLGYTYLSSSGVVRSRVPDHAIELRPSLGPQPDPRLGRRKFDLGLADGPDPL